jgi:hypothetical protein
MDDHQTETITHLRDVIKELQTKLEYRTTLLAQIIPHLETWALEPQDDSSSSYICHEIMEKFCELLTRFKDEYAKEIQQREVGKL